MASVEHCAVGIETSGADDDLAAVVAQGVGSVRHEVHHHLSDLGAVAVHVRKIGREVVADSRSARRGGLEQQRYVLDDR